MEYVVGEDVNQKKHLTVIDLIKYHRGVTGKLKPIQLKDGTQMNLKKAEGYYILHGLISITVLAMVPYRP